LQSLWSERKSLKSTPTHYEHEANWEIPVKILFVASECAPFIKTGGLGDAVAGLSKSLRNLGHEVRILVPLYSDIDRTKHGIAFNATACIHMGGNEEQWIGLHSAMLDQQVPIWFVECERFFARPGIYHDTSGEYGDNAFRFALLSKAAIQICKDTKFIPDVMHLHDWPTALVAVFLQTWDKIASPLSDTASVLTIHNIGHQGVYDASAFPYIGVGDEHYTGDKFENYGKINLLKAGVHFADSITTVSPTHAREILEPIGGQGLAPYLNARQHDFFGILNGTDYDHWDPKIDPLIPAHYSPENLSGKAACKAVLQQRFHLEARPSCPVIGIVSRFAHQKGFDLLKEALPRAIEDMVFQFVVLGTGDRRMEDFMRGLTSAYPGRVGDYIGFSNELSHLIEAGSDFFVMPSLYEPCGLNQMYSMKYGTLPIVRATGGLDDSVQNYDESSGTGTGFKFWEPTASALYYTIGWAVSTWFDRPEHIAKLRQQAMAQEFSWDISASKYLEVYEHALRRKRS